MFRHAARPEVAPCPSVTCVGVSAVGKPVITFPAWFV